MMTSLCTQYWQTMLAQGVVVGIGNGCLFVPSVAIIPQYFTSKKSLANGIAASGASFGGIAYPIMLYRLIHDVGFPWATRIIGFTCLATLLFSVSVMKPQYLPKQKRKMMDLGAFKEWPYTFFSISLFFLFLGFYGPIVSLEPYLSLLHTKNGHSIIFSLTPYRKASLTRTSAITSCLSSMLLRCRDESYPVSSQIMLAL